MSLNIAGAMVIKHGRNGIAIVSNGEHLVLYTKNETEFSTWFLALTNASEHRLEKYYMVRGVLGQGGFATVRLGHGKGTRETVAIKSIDKSRSSPTFLRREVEVIKAVDHPNVVETYDVFETEHKFHIVMEYMKGGMLLDIMQGRHTLSEAKTRYVITQILEGVAYLHAQGIVHRDLKPENVLICRRGTLDVKLADFGLATFYEAGSEKLMSTLIGTPQFVAPELVQNEAYGAEVDLWAVGIMLYYFLGGRLPFDEEEVIPIYASKKFEIHFPLSAWENVSAEARSLTMQLLCKDPSRRVSAIGALQHSWFSIPLRTDIMERNGAFGTHNWKKARVAKASVFVWKPFNSLRKAVHVVRFLLRLSARAGFISTFAVRVLPLSRSESSASNSSGLSYQSSNLSDWDFQGAEFDLHPESEGDRNNTASKSCLVLEPDETGIDVQKDCALETTQLLREVEAKLANADLECPNRKSFRAQRRSVVANIETRGNSVAGAVPDANGFGLYSLDSTPTRAASERPKQIGTHGFMSSPTGFSPHQRAFSLKEKMTEHYSYQGGEEVLSPRGVNVSCAAATVAEGARKGRRKNLPVGGGKSRSRGAKLTKAKNWFANALGGMREESIRPK